MSADGTNQRELTSGPLDDIEPSWSRDGTIAFSRGTGYNQSNFVDSTIWVMAANGTGAHALPAPSDTVNYRPSWSPDGRHIAFVRDGMGGLDAPNAEIWVMDRDGAHQHQVTTSGANNTFPTWSPDGTRLAFECGFDICTIGVDGRGLVKLTHTGDALAPNWYPGNRIVFPRSIGTGVAPPGGPSTKVRQIFVMNPDGSGVIRVTNDSYQDIFPAWSPDGGTIAFSQATTSVLTACCGFQIVTVHADGSDRRVLTRASAVEPLLGESFPTYAP
jgi:TolB protein